MKRKLLIALGCLPVLTACSEESTTDVIYKKSAVEVVLESMRLDNSRDIIKITRTYYKDFKTLGTTVSYDTVPAAGDINLYDENDNRIVQRDDYEFYVTVK